MKRSRNVRIAIGCAIILGTVGVLGVLSWATQMHWKGSFGPGDWSICVRDNQGRPVPGVHVEYLSARDDRFVTFPADGEVVGKEIFDNYSGPDSVVSATDGIIRLYNTRDRRYSGTEWRLFWIWPVRTGPAPRESRLRLFAGGYESVTVKTGDLVSNGRIDVVLPQRPSPPTKAGDGH
jgi:hypothetical protein